MDSSNSEKSDKGYGQKSPPYWKRSVVAPKSIERPNPGQEKGYYYFGQKNKTERDPLWSEVGASTTNGDLGYYAGYSNDSEVIAVHFSDPKQEEETHKIKNGLKDLGIVDISYKTKPAENERRVEDSQQN